MGLCSYHSHYNNAGDDYNRIIVILKIKQKKARYQKEIDSKEASNSREKYSAISPLSLLQTCLISRKEKNHDSYDSMLFFGPEESQKERKE